MCCCGELGRGRQETKMRNPKSKRVLSEVSDVLRWVVCGPQSRSAAWFATYETRVLCLRSSAVNAGDLESM